MSTLGKVWLIGADSFTGRYLLPLLEQKAYQVDSTVVDISNKAEVEAAILNIKPDYIINLAGISFVPDGQDESIYAINTFGPQYILDACLKLKKSPKRIILASSSTIYGPQGNERLNEHSLVNPTNHYACSKWAMEQIAATYADRLNITITRPFNYTGVGQDIKFLVPKIISHFKQKAATIKLGNIDVWRDFSDVRWIAKTYMMLLIAGTERLHIVNLCSGRLVSIREIIASLEELSGHALQVKVAAEFVRSVDIRKQCGDNKALYQLLSREEPPPSIESTLDWMLATAKG